MPDSAETAAPKATKRSRQAKPMAPTTIPTISTPEPPTEPSTLENSTTNLPMATPLTMPVQGKCLAPTFDRTRPRELPQFFSDLDWLFKIHDKLTKTEKKEYVVYYTDFETKQTWSLLNDMTSND